MLMNWAPVPGAFLAHVSSCGVRPLDDRPPPSMALLRTGLWGHAPLGGAAPFLGQGWPSNPCFFEMVAISAAAGCSRCGAPVQMLPGQQAIHPIEGDRAAKGNQSIYYEIQSNYV